MPNQTIQCLIKLPNSVVVEIDVDLRCRGQECLDRVCEMLGIIEVDYFGLQYHGQHGDLLWLNLRNPVKQQMTCYPFRLLLKVKFFIPPHLLLQETTKHQFFLNLVTDLQEGRLRVKSRDVALKMTALVAQSELGDVDTSHEDTSGSDAKTATLLSYRKWLPFSLIEMVSGAEGIANERLVDQDKRKASDSMNLKSKRKQQFSRKSSAESSDESSSNPSTPLESQSQLSSTLQMTLEPGSPIELMSTSPPTSLLFLQEKSVYLDSDNELPILCDSVYSLHQKLKGMKASKAKYLFLKEVSKLEDFGLENFPVRMSDTPEEPLMLGVGPKGVYLIACPKDCLIDHQEEEPSSCLESISSQHRISISYSSIHMVTNSGRNLLLTFFGEKGDTQPLALRCDSSVASHAIYRSITEKHAFYSCETVRNAVTSQFIRDLKGTIVSLFNENTHLGKNYVFDIRRTCREVYDHTRRALYQLENVKEGKCKGAVKEEGNLLDENLKDIDHDHDVTGKCCRLSCQERKLKLDDLSDSLLCRCCIDKEVNTAFFPCRHVVCCSECAPLCDTCPLCRSPVESREKIFLPVSTPNTPCGASPTKGIFCLMK